MKIKLFKPHESVPDVINVNSTIESHCHENIKNLELISSEFCVLQSILIERRQWVSKILTEISKKDFIVLKIVYIVKHFYINYFNY